MKILRLFCAAFCAAFCVASVVSCEKENKRGNGNGGNDVTIPQVVFSGITSASFSAEWEEVPGADSYRYEVTRTEDGRTVAVAAANISAASFSLDALRPGTDYVVKVAARSNGKTSTDKFVGSVKTLGDGKVSFETTPVESFDKTDGYVYPVAKVVPSDDNLYYFVSAVPIEYKDRAEEWMLEDISYYTELLSWEEMLEEGLILKGEASSLPFRFTAYDTYHFVVAALEKTMAGISLCSDISFSYEFWAEASDMKVQHMADYDDYLGDWLLTSYRTIATGSDGKLTMEAGETFPVSIGRSAEGGFELTGWGGDRNRFSSHPLKLDYVAASDGYNTFSINFPQNIKTENGVKWQYVSWFNFVGTLDGDDVNLYVPYDDAMHESAPEWSTGFVGYIANQNRTVIKIFPQDYVSPEFPNEGAFMMALWLYGTDEAGQGHLLNGKYEEPAAYYFLTRKDVADGVELPIPDYSTEAVSSAARPASAVSSATVSTVARPARAKHPFGN